MKATPIFAGRIGYSDSGHRPNVLLAEHLGLAAVCDVPQTSDEEVLQADIYHQIKTTVSNRSSIIITHIEKDTLTGRRQVEDMLTEVIRDAIDRSLSVSFARKVPGLPFSSMALCLFAGARAFFVLFGEGTALILHNSVFQPISIRTQGVERPLATLTRRQSLDPQFLKASSAHSELRLELISAELAPGDRILLLPGNPLVDRTGAPTSLEPIQNSDFSNWLSEMVASCPNLSPWENTVMLQIELEDKLDPRASFCGSEWGDWQRVPVFSYLSFQEGLQIMALAERRWIPAQRNIVTEGEVGDELYFVESGSVEISAKGSTIRVARSGDIVGEVSLYTGATRSATARALEMTSVLCIHRKQLFSLFLRNPGIENRFQRGIIEELCRKLRSNVDQLFLNASTSNPG